MRYVALKPLTYLSRRQGGQVIEARPGEEVVGFSDWPRNAQRAVIGQGYVVAAPQAAVQSEPAAQLPVSALAAEAETTAAELTQIVCPSCPRTFQSEHGLRLHTAKAHRQAAGQ